MANLRTIGFQLVGMGLVVGLTYLAVQHLVTTGTISVKASFSPAEVQQRVLAITGLVSLFTAPLGIVLATFFTGGHFSATSEWRELSPQRLKNLDSGEVQFLLAPYRLIWWKSFPLRLGFATLLLSLIILAKFSSGSLFYLSTVGVTGLSVLFISLYLKETSFSLDLVNRRLVDQKGRSISTGYAALVGLPVEYWVGGSYSRRKVRQLEVGVVRENGKVTPIGLEDRGPSLEVKLYRLSESLGIPLFIGPEDSRCKVRHSPGGIKVFAKPNPLMAWMSERENIVVPR